MSEPKLSHVEEIKLHSRQLRGTIAEELLNDLDRFAEDTTNVLKHHGTYQQDDRDRRHEKLPDGTPRGKAYNFMVRTRVPGGKVTARQLLDELDLADRFASGTVRFTSRQGIQLHGVLRKNLKATIRAINEAKLTTLAACGDVERNVMCCPAPLGRTAGVSSAVRDQLQAVADALAEHLKPRTTAYWEIWLREEGQEESVQVSEYAPVEEPLYGDRYLPRKFKTAIALPEDNCVDIHANDLGFLAVHDGARIEGFEVLVGGGMGMTPSAKKTFPAVARPMAFVRPDQVLACAEAVIKVQRDHGNRSDRKQARLKYLIHNWGMEKFKAAVEEMFGGALPPPRGIEVQEVDDHLGWHEQGDGRWFLGINIENGRVKDDPLPIAGKPHLRIKTGLRTVLERFGMPGRITPLQSLLLCDVEPAWRAEIDRILADHGILPAEQLTPVRRYAMACPAWPTCGLSITEAERVFPDVLDELEAELARLGIPEERIAVHMTGCPNGCARPYTPDIGFVGKAAGERYTIYVGGNALGTRLAFLYADMIEREKLIPFLAPLLRQFRDARQPGESFGDFCHRLGPQQVETLRPA